LSKNSDFSLELETKLKVPAPLDPHIASVTIRTDANNPNDFFDLRLSAAFGSEYVLLESGDDKFEVEICIRKAEIVLDPVNCGLHALASEHTDAWTGNQWETAGYEDSKSIDSSAAVDLSKAVPTGFKGEIAASAKHATANSFTAQQELLPWRLQSAEVIQIGYLPDFKRELLGRIIDESISVRVTPNDRGKKVGVLARLRVRERWIDIKDVRTRKVSERLGDFISGLGSQEPNVKRRLELFERLLAHLVHIQLQDEAEMKDATLAASAVVFSPATERMVGVPSPSSPNTIKIDPTVIDGFIATDVGEEVGYLKNVGVELEGQNENSSETILDIWKRSPNRKHLATRIHPAKLAAALSGSLGLETEWHERVESPAYISNFSVQISDGKAPTLDAPAIVEILNSAEKLMPWSAEEAAVYLGILTKGEEAFNIAQALGFTGTYRTFISKLRPYAVKSGYGYLMSLSRVFSLCGRTDAAREFIGLTVSGQQFHPDTLNYR
jgi:hypothetical protein